jgi:16S rRNA (cytidine1402-2'-O)-methyltransferase
LHELAEVLGAERQASISREISKLHEETVRGTLPELAEHFEAHPPKGEFVLCVAGA